MTNWKEIHSDFTEKLQKEWEDRGFKYRQVKWGIEIGLRPQDVSFAEWLRDVKKKYPTKWVSYNHEELKKEYQTCLKKINSQVWLDKNYPKEERGKINEIYLNKSKLEGELDLKDFTYQGPWGGVVVYISHFVDESKLIIRNRNEKTHIIKLIWVQEYINKNYFTKEEREKVTQLHINQKKLEGKLDLFGFTNLEELDCSGNELTNLNLTDCINLKSLNFSYNKLTDISFLNQLTNPKKLKSLYLNGNGIVSDLKSFSRFVNLEYLILGSYEDYDWVAIDDEGLPEEWKVSLNKFHGSLEPLKNMHNLRLLDISNTDIDDGIEFLSNRLLLDISVINYYNREGLSFSVWERPESKLKKIEWQLDLFSSRRLKKWEEFGFGWKEIKSLREVGLSSYEYGFANYLKNEKELSEQKIKDDLTGLRKEYYNIIDDGKLSEKVISKLKKINYSGGYRSCLTPEEELTVDKLIINEELRRRYKKYGLCRGCNQPTTWICRTCNPSFFQLSFGKLNNGKELISKLVEKYQLEVAAPNVTPSIVLQWIPYEQFTNIKKIGEGAFSKVYRAEWIGRSVSAWSIELEGLTNFSWVTLKVLKKSHDINEIAREINYHTILSNKWTDSEMIVKFFGISQDPKTKEHIMIMQYIPNGNLRQYLKDNYNKLNLEDKLSQLSCIASGLSSIHDKGLIHCDFHSGNILKHTRTSYVTDLGLCRIIGETDKEKVYGVLPYVAPEILWGKSYTQASDVYSFGIVVYEILTGLPPYHNMLHNVDLALKIHDGLRPNLNKIQVPQLLKDLISKCWNADPQKRPTAGKLEENIWVWYNDIIKKREDSEFYQQFKKIKTKNSNEILSLSDNTLSSEMTESSISSFFCQTSLPTIYTSQLLPNTSKLRNSPPINDEFCSFLLPLSNDFQDIIPNTNSDLTNNLSLTIGSINNVSTSESRMDLSVAGIKRKLFFTETQEKTKSAKLDKAVKKLKTVKVDDSTQLQLEPLEFLNNYQESDRVYQNLGETLDKVTQQEYQVQQPPK